MTDGFITVRARVADLWNDGGSWSENASWARQVELKFPANTSDVAIARRVKKELGIQGMRVDHWSGADWSWREGCVGAYADVIHID